MDWKDLKRVEVSGDKVACDKCGENILDIHNAKYAGETRAYARFSEELYECRNCGEKYVMRYDRFDEEGHIKSKTFAGDVNDPKLNWVDNLTEAQKREVNAHLKSCPICQDRLNAEVLNDAWFAHQLRKDQNGKE